VETNLTNLLQKTKKIECCVRFFCFFVCGVSFRFKTLDKLSNVSREGALKKLQKFNLFYCNIFFFRFLRNMSILSWRILL